MIYDTLVHIEEYRGLSTQMDLALEILKNTDFLSVDPGKYIINDDVYYNVLEAQTRDLSETKWECHRKYIDIQYVVSAGEQIAYCPLEDVRKWSDYSAEGDSCISTEDVSSIALPMGENHFAIFFPGDAHRPCWAVGKPKRIKKVVIKVRI